MIDKIKGFREPAAVVAVGIVLFGIVATTGQIVEKLQSYPLAQVLRGVDGLYGLVDALVLTVLALSCVLVAPRTRHANLITTVAASLLWLGAIVGLVFLVLSLVAADQSSISRILESIGGLCDIALRALMGYVLILARRVDLSSAREPTAEPSEEAPATEQVPAVVTESSPRPIWQPDDATGVVWRSASEAASGAAAGTFSSFSSSGKGWEVPPEAAEMPSIHRVGSDELTSLMTPKTDSSEPVSRSEAPIWDPAGDLMSRDGEAQAGE